MDGVKVWSSGGNVTWLVYEEAILKRFREVNEDPMAEYKNLRYKTTMKQYQSDFEILLNQMEITEAQSVRKKIRNTTYLAKPITTALALPNTQTITKYPATTTNPPKKWLTQKEIGDKRAKGLCFYCDQKYMSGHKCSGQMFVLEVILDDKEDLQDSIDTNEEEELGNPTENGENLLSKCYASPQISLNAISGTPTFNTMIIKALVAKHLLHLLMDTGRTYNFIDFVNTRKLVLVQIGLRQYPLTSNIAGGAHSFKRSCDHRIPLKDDIAAEANKKNTVKDKFPILVIEALIDELQALLNKMKAFSWNNKSLDSPLKNLQQAMSQVPVLALPNFQEEFIIETDASGYGIVSVLRQKGVLHVAFLQNFGSLRHLSLFAYEKELLAVVVALQKWRGYLLDRHFKIRTDHFSLNSYHNKSFKADIEQDPERDFLVGEWVLSCRSQPYRQLTVKKGKEHKLYVKFYGPFLVLAKIGQVAYKLQLPPNAKVHPVFPYRDPERAGVGEERVWLRRDGGGVGSRESRLRVANGDDTLQKMELMNMTPLCDIGPMIDDLKVLVRCISPWKSHPAGRPNEVWALDMVFQDAQVRL
ncbi:gypsy/ty3 retroelement polyprotein [Tanacetum coccineum]